ncbi:hypothetical protein BC831DRAFT_513833 [Entophlyctis helioformis]|nr:hypothetical protein BC831DRAFT_513833 [Entophlyctis helioformis]
MGEQPHATTDHAGRRVPEFLTPFELQQRPIPVPRDSDTATVTLLVKSLNTDFKCPVCLGILSNTTVTSDCLHRFCRDCIVSSLRFGKKECPTCRAKCASKRSLRPDVRFDELIRVLYPNLEEMIAQQDHAVDVFAQTQIQNAATAETAAAPATAGRAYKSARDAMQRSLSVLMDSAESVSSSATDPAVAPSGSASADAATPPVTVAFLGKGAQRSSQASDQELQIHLTAETKTARKKDVISKRIKPANSISVHRPAHQPTRRSPRHASPPTPARAPASTAKPLAMSFPLGRLAVAGAAAAAAAAGAAGAAQDSPKHAELTYSIN